MVYQDHLTKFVDLRPLQRKSADEVVNHLLDIFSLFGFPHILQSDNGREFNNINLATMIRDKWPECKIVHGSHDTRSTKALLKELKDKEGFGFSDEKKQRPVFGEISQQFSIFYQHQPTLYTRIRNTIQSFV